MNVMKILKKFEKFEENTNNALNKVLNKIWLLILSLIPQIVFDTYHKVKNWIIRKSIEWFNNSKDFIKFHIKKFHEYKTNLFDLIDKIQAFPIKSKIFEFGNFLKELLLKTPLKTHVDTISNFTSSTFHKFFNFLEKINTPQTYIATTAMLMILFGTYNIYVSSSNIYLQEFNTREPASQQQYIKKPEYQAYEKRTLKVFNVKVPIFQESISAIRSVTIDFTVRTDTRFSKQYLEEYEYKLKDYFFLTVEPVVSEFPLEEEGKSILKDKIQRELNNFLKVHGVEGEVVEVKIVFIIAS